MVIFSIENSLSYFAGLATSLGNYIGGNNCKKHGYCKRIMSEKFKSVFHKVTSNFTYVPANKIKNTLVNTNKESKISKLSNNKNESYIIKISRHIPNGFVISVGHTKNIEHKK